MILICSVSNQDDSMIKFRSLLILLTVGFGALFGLYREGFAQQQRVLDSLQRLLPTLPNDTNKVRLLNRIATEQQGNPEQCRATAEQAKKLAEQLDYRSGVIDALAGIINSHVFQAHYPEIIRLSEEMLFLAQLSNNRKAQSRAYLNISNAEWRQGNYDAALDKCFLVLSILEELRDTAGLTSLYSQFGSIYGDMNNHARSLVYYQKAWTVSQCLPLSSQVISNQAAFLNNIGDAYSKLQQLDSAIPYFQRAYVYYERANNAFGRAIARANTGEAWLRLRRYSEADTSLAQALSLATFLKTDDLVAYILLVYCQLETARKNLPKAIRYGNQSLALSDKLGNRAFARDALEALSKAYSQQGNARLALETYKRFYTLKDSLFNAETTKRAASLEAKYITEKKDKEIRLLQMEREQQVTADKQQRYIIIAVSLALLFAVGFGVQVVRSNRLQKRDNKRIQAISRIGADLAGSLIFRDVVLKIHHEVQHIMDAPIFNIGVYVPEKECIEFRYLIENGTFLSPPLVSMTETERPAVRCIRERKEIVINDQDIPILVGAKPQSLVYIPLITNDTVIGVFSVQSFRKHSYSKGKVRFLQAISSHIATAIENIRAFEKIEQQREELTHEREKSETLLLNILPAPIAQRLKSGERAIAERFDAVTVLFADIVGFTKLSANTTPEKLVQGLNAIFERFDALAAKYGLEKIKTIGDAYMVAGGLPERSQDHCQRVARFALEMQAVMHEEALQTNNGETVQLRIGIHTGAAVAGVIGKSKFAYDLWGDTVNTASRMESHGEAGKIHCSQEVYNTLQQAFLFEERGEMEIKGKGVMRTWFLTGIATTVHTARQGA
jgi:class 3 adenylate cyclase/tetratricopeptide (TPR) repeat protein